MSALLDAARGLPNAHEPVPGLVTGGQPDARQLDALRAAGCRLVIDLRDPMEPRPLRTPAAVEALGLEYVNIPVGHVEVPAETFSRVRATVQRLVGDGTPALLHCGSGNRVGAALIPYLMLDKGMDEEAAITEAMRIGTRNAGLVEAALEYVRAQGA
jgi:protein tyrosine phosphatase (PTP) superfamily phosphohydrolase (DUF442 family)